MTDLISLLNKGLEGSYHIKVELGRGGMATVYRAEDLRHDRTVAVKVLLPELAAVVGSGRFLREIQIAAKLRHPHILPLLDSGEVERLPFYVMPFVEGESLREKLTREKQLPLDEALLVAQEVADALSYAHTRGVVHRDIKPANIMLDSGHAVVADFGIALATHQLSSDRLTASGLSPGSPQYMSPEQAAGEGDIDGRSDIYSLGCVLFEALAGDPPFAGRIPQAIFAKKLREPPPNLRVVRDSIPEDLERVVSKALARSPADRFRTAAEFREALKAVADGKPLDAPATHLGGGVDRNDLAVSKWARMASLAATVTVSLLIGMVLLTAIGFLTTRAYDVKLGIPAEYTPSRLDFPIVGLQALVPELFWGFLGLILYVAISYAWRLGWAGLHRAPGIGDTLDSWRNNSSKAWTRLWAPLGAITVADLFFLGAIATGILALGPFRELLTSLWTPGTGVLSSSYRSLHKNYTMTLTPLIVILFLGWRSVFRYLRRRGTVGGRVAASRWGSLAWIVFLLMMVTLPWRLLWNNEHERVLLDGERAYILVETSADLVIYHSATGSTVRYPKNDEMNLERLGAIGYLFESVEAFEAGGPGSSGE